MESEMLLEIYVSHFLKHGRIDHWVLTRLQSVGFIFTLERLTKALDRSKVTHEFSEIVKTKDNILKLKVMIKRAPRTWRHERGSYVVYDILLPYDSNVGIELKVVILIWSSYR